MRYFIIIAATVLFAECLAGRSASPQATGAPSTPVALTFCGLTDYASLHEPPVGSLPENERLFYGIWSGTAFSASFGAECLAVVVTNIASDGSADVLMYVGKAPTVLPEVRHLHGTISGDILTIPSRPGWPIKITMKDRDHLEWYFHNIFSSLGDFRGPLERVGTGTAGN